MFFDEPAAQYYLSTSFTRIIYLYIISHRHYKKLMSRYQPSRGPVVLCIMDGWGHRTERGNNAIALARTPVFDSLIDSQPHSLLDASGANVGLPDGQVGNSEGSHEYWCRSCGDAGFAPHK